MPNRRKAVSSAGVNDCLRGPNEYESSVPTGFMSGLPLKGKLKEWPEFAVSWHGRRGCRRAAKEKLLKACVKKVAADVRRRISHQIARLSASSRRRLPVLSRQPGQIVSASLRRVHFIKIRRTVRAS